MGTLVGHVAPGFGFLAIGVWHLLNHIRLHAGNPKASHASLPWFPAPRIRHLELFLIMAGCLASISMELFIGPEKHQPLDTDGTIPSNHLHNFEHSNISLAFLAYAVLCVALDRTSAPARNTLSYLLAAVAFGQELLLFHLHSADHMGVEGQYHWLLQIVVFVSLATTLLSIPFPESFPNSFVRSYSLLLQGGWFVVTGFVLWTPGLTPKGCFISSEEGHQVVRCRGHDALERAKSLVNIQFSWYVIGATVMAVVFYLVLVRLYGDHKEGEYQSLSGTTCDDDEQEEGITVMEDIESQKGSQNGGPTRRFLQVEKLVDSLEMER